MARAASTDERTVLDPERDALFLDYDGTLTEIVPRPEDAILPPARRAALEAAAARFGGALAVLSGRALADLTTRVGIAMWRGGGHGHQMAAPGEGAPATAEPAPAALLRAAEGVAARRAGVIVEPKPGGLALHFRGAPEAEAECVAAMQRALEAAPDHVLQHGKMVVEARPRGADKGVALRRLMALAPFDGRRPVMIGDDLTDEDAMRAALDLGGLAIKVGDGPSAATLRVESVDAVYALFAAGPSGA